MNIDSERDGRSEPGSEKRSFDPRMMTPPAKVQKRVLSSLRVEYIRFQKYYYNRTKKEHPNWNAKQISKVISILWMKKKRRVKKGIVKR